MTAKGLRVEFRLPERRAARPTLPDRTASTTDAVPRAARLLALAWKWELAVRRGETTCAEIARKHGLSRARVTQICGLVLLTPNHQQILLVAASCEYGYWERSVRLLRGASSLICWQQHRVVDNAVKGLA